jgi:hypothetical protein
MSTAFWKRAVIPFGGVASLFLKQSRTGESTPASKKDRVLPNEITARFQEIFNQSFLISVPLLKKRKLPGCRTLPGSCGIVWGNTD